MTGGQNIYRVRYLSGSIFAVDKLLPISVPDPTWDQIKDLFNANGYKLGDDGVLTVKSLTSSGKIDCADQIDATKGFYEQ